MSETVIFFYNLWQITTWSLLIVLTLFYILVDPLCQEHQSPYDSNPIWRLFLWTAQGTQVVDILLSAIGATKNSILTVFPQIFSRLYVMFVIFPSIADDKRFLIAFVIMFWGLSEMVRFLFYTIRANATIGWLRYNLFTVVQPSSVLTELYCIWSAYSKVTAIENATDRPWTVLMPNLVNFELHFELTVWVAVFLFVFGTPQIYMHLLS